MTLMPSAAQAMASDLVSCTTAALLVPLAGLRGLPKVAYIGATLISAPPAALRWR